MTGAILIVAHNGLHLTKAAVRTAKEQDIPCDIMVIDNASQDATSQWLKTKDVIITSYREQLSLAACWNRGLKAFFHAGHDRVLVVNNDVELLPFTCGALTYINLPFVTAVGVDKREQMDVIEQGSYLETARPHPDFSCFMISKEVTEKVGWFNESYYPAYAEDCEYHVRMHKAGVEAVCISLPFLHVGCGSLKNANPAECNAIRRGADANRERFKKQFGCCPGSKEYESLFV